MRGGVLPPALLLAALALALAPASPRIWLWSLAALVCTLAALRGLEVRRDWLEIVFLGCWISTAATAAAVYIPVLPGRAGSVALSINAAVWTSLVVGLSGLPADTVKALAALLLTMPAAWLVTWHGGVALKVASSWLIAIAILAGSLPLLPVTPGYLPDHLE